MSKSEGAKPAETVAPSHTDNVHDTETKNIEDDRDDTGLFVNPSAQVNEQLA